MVVGFSTKNEMIEATLSGKLKSDLLMEGFAMGPSKNHTDTQSEEEKHNRMSVTIGIKGIFGGIR